MESITQIATRILTEIVARHPQMKAHLSVEAVETIININPLCQTSKDVINILKTHQSFI